MRVVLLAIVLLAVRPASADPVEEAAQVHLDRGIAAFERRDYLGAHEELAAANKLVPEKPNPYRWLALTEVQLGDCERARVNIEGFLSRVAEDDARRAEMLRLRDLCSRTGTLSIRTTPDKAQLRIDGAQVGPAPYRSGSFAVGNHKVVAVAPGYEASSRNFALEASSTLDLHLELHRPSTSITRRWWFIPAVVGAAAIAGGAIYFATRSDTSTSSLPGVICDASGCHAGGP
jgi:hypothetical protein